jgi:hypothetical protein
VQLAGGVAARERGAAELQLRKIPRHQAVVSSQQVGFQVGSGETVGFRNFDRITLDGRVFYLVFFCHSVYDH